MQSSRSGCIEEALTAPVQVAGVRVDDPEDKDSSDPYADSVEASSVDSQSTGGEMQCDDRGDDVQAAGGSATGTTRHGSVTDAATSGISIMRLATPRPWIRRQDPEVPDADEQSVPVRVPDEPTALWNFPLRIVDSKYEWRDHFSGTRRAIGCGCGRPRKSWMLSPLPVRLSV